MEIYQQASSNLHRHWDRYVAPGAFMIFNTQDPDGTGPRHSDYLGRSNAPACKANVEEALRRGVASEICAIYFMTGNNYSIKFTRCDASCEAVGL